MSLASRIRELRRKTGQSLQQVADGVNASKAHIWDLERGEAKNPSIELVKALAGHFGVSVASLIGEEAPGDDEDALRMYRDYAGLDERAKLVIDDMIATLKRRQESR